MKPIEELNKIITVLANEEGLSEYGQALLEGYSVHLKSELGNNVNDCCSTLEDTIDLIEHTSRVLDIHKEKGIAMKILDRRVKNKLKHFEKLKQ